MKKKWIMLGVALAASGFTYRVVQAVERTRVRVVEAKPVAVQTLLLKAQLATRYVTFTGNVRPRNEVDVSPKGSGRIRSVYVGIGDRVKAGDVLADIENSEVSLQLEQARAGEQAARLGLEHAVDEASRTEELYRNQGVSESQFTALQTRRRIAESQLAQAEAAVKLARQMVRNTIITAPIGGVVTRRNVGVGQLVAPGLPAFQVQDASRLHLSGGIAAEDLPFILLGAPVEIRVDGRRENTVGSVTRIAPSLDPYTRRASVEVGLDDAKPPLLANTFVHARIRVSGTGTRLTVPSMAVVQEGAQSFVFRVEGDRAVRSRVEVAFTLDHDAELSSGARAGDRIVVNGQQFLTDGDRVAVQAAAELPTLEASREH